MLSLATMPLLTMIYLALRWALARHLPGRMFTKPVSAVVMAHPLMEIRLVGKERGDLELEVLRRRNNLRHGRLINKLAMEAEVLGMGLIQLVPDMVVLQVAMGVGDPMLALAGLTMPVRAAPLAQAQAPERHRGRPKAAPKAYNPLQTILAEQQGWSLHGHKHNVNKLRRLMHDNRYYLILLLRFLLAVCIRKEPR
jgi:hypothetical protein